MGSREGYGFVLKFGFAAASAIATAFGCSLTIDADRAQCSTTTDCKSRGAAFADSVCVDSLCAPLRSVEPEDGGYDPSKDPTWGCLGKPPAPASSDPGPFNVLLNLTDVLSGGPHGDIHVKLCKKIDTACEIPINTTELISDADGHVAISVPRAFSGYLELKGDTVLTGLYYFNPPPEADVGTPGLTIQLVTPSTVELLTKSLGSQQVSDRGLTLVNVFDCEKKPAVGATFEADIDPGDELATIFYAVKGLPVKDATETDTSGYGGLVNLPARSVTLKASVQTEAGKRNIGTTTIQIKAGAITYTRLVPDGT